MTGMVFVIIWEMFIYIYNIPHRKYQVKPPSSPLFSAACSAAIVHRNHFFVCINKVNLLNIKESSDRLVFVAKGFLKLPNMHMLIELPLPRNLALGTFGELLIVFSTKVNLLYLLYWTAWSCCLLYLIKQNCLLKPVLRTLILMAQVFLYLFSFLELTWNCIIFLYLPRWLKRS